MDVTSHENEAFSLSLFLLRFQTLSSRKSLLEKEEMELTVSSFESISSSESPSEPHELESSSIPLATDVTKLKPEMAPTYHVDF